MWICYRHCHTLGKFNFVTKVTCQYPGQLVSGSISKACICVRTVTFSVTISFLSRDIFTRKEKKLVIRLRVLKDTSH